MKKGKKIIVVGGGAAGMCAAIAAAREGANVTIYEQMQRVGKKLLATGNGRCNITNKNIKLDRYHGKNTEFARFGLEKYNTGFTMDFFESLGITLKEEECGKMFPYSGQASSVLDVLRYEIKKLNINEICEAEVRKIIPEKSSLSVLLKDGTKEECDSVILATGGRANANLGSTGTGYKLATDLGHKMIDTFPALVQLKLDFQYLKAVSGVKFIGKAEIVEDGKVLKSDDGELLFTDYGISGPPILQLSRSAAVSLNRRLKPVIIIDMFPEYDFHSLKELLYKKIKLDDNKEMDFCLVGLINKKLIPVILKLVGITDIHIKTSEVTDNEIDNIVNVLKQLTIEIVGTQPYRDAQVTAGGIDVKDIDNKTMESKIIKGLYICGEMLDIDGDCGGFNLQWAWTSGYIAGISAANYR